LLGQCNGAKGKIAMARRLLLETALTLEWIEKSLEMDSCKDVLNLLNAERG
jgi:hypothetical protein